MMVCVHSKFAPDILHDEGTMDLLTLCAKRIEHMQVYITALVYSLILVTATLQGCSNKLVTRLH